VLVSGQWSVQGRSPMFPWHRKAATMNAGNWARNKVVNYGLFIDWSIESRDLAGEQLWITRHSIINVDHRSVCANETEFDLARPVRASIVMLKCEPQSRTNLFNVIIFLFIYLKLHININIQYCYKMLFKIRDLQVSSLYHYSQQSIINIINTGKNEG